jgi:hypothetical protein
MAYNTNLGYGNYNALTVSAKKRFAKGVQFQASYSFARNLSNVDGAATTTADQFAGEFGGFVSDPRRPNLDYGNVSFTRRNRLLTTFLYELPFGKGKTLLTGANGFVDRVVGGWELSGVLLFQGGPFMSVSTLSDPCGCGYNAFNANGAVLIPLRASILMQASRSTNGSIRPHLRILATPLEDSEMQAPAMSSAQGHRPCRYLLSGASTLRSGRACESARRWPMSSTTPISRFRAISRWGSLDSGRSPVCRLRKAPGRGIFN